MYTFIESSAYMHIYIHMYTCIEMYAANSAVMYTVLTALYTMRALDSR